MLLAAVALADNMKEKVPLAHFGLYTDLMGIEGAFRAIETTQRTSENSNFGACKLLVKELRVHPLKGVDWDDGCGCRLCTRDHKAAQLLVAICRVIHTKANAVQPYHAVVVVDELGCYPSFVRAVCALGQPFRTNLAKHLHLERVSIVMGGTGSESPDLSPWSRPETLKLIHAATNLWPVLVASDCELLAPFDALMTPPDAKRGLPDVRLVSAKLAHDLSTNARAAALLATELRNTCSTVPEGGERNYSVLFGTATLSTALQYKKKNSLNKLSLEDHRLLVLSAVAASHFLPCDMELVPLVDNAKLSPRMHSCIMVDRVVANTSQLALNAKFCGRRFDVSAAQVAVLKLLMDTATRDISGSGFELSTADFLLFALMLAKGRPGKIINRVDGVVCKSSAAVVCNGSATLPTAASEFPACWISLQDFICTLAADFKGLPHCPTTVRHLKAQHVTINP